MVNAVRKEPFGEWNVVYFDPARVSAEQVLALIREKGCKHAAPVPAVILRTPDTTLEIEAPVVVPGDLVPVSVHPAAGDKSLRLTVDVPPEVAVAINGGSNDRFYLQTARDLKPGKHKVTLRVGGERTGESALSFEIEIVDRVM